MKVAVPLFKEKLSPRIDVADGFYFYNISEGVVHSKQSFLWSSDHPVRLITFLREQNIDTVLCGGCPGFIFRMLGCRGVEVVRGVTGVNEPDSLVDLWISGSLKASPGCPLCSKKRHRGGKRL